MMRALVRGCARCGSDWLRMPSIADGVIVGIGQNLSLMACQACDWVGVPLEFDDAAALAAFARSRRST